MSSVKGFPVVQPNRSYSDRISLSFWKDFHLLKMVITPIVVILEKTESFILDWLFTVHTRDSQKLLSISRQFGNKWQVAVPLWESFRLWLASKCRFLCLYTIHSWSVTTFHARLISCVLRTSKSELHRLYMPLSGSEWLWQHSIGCSNDIPSAASLCWSPCLARNRLDVWKRALKRVTGSFLKWWTVLRQPISDWVK